MQYRNSMACSTLIHRSALGFQRQISGNRLSHTRHPLPAITNLGCGGVPRRIRRSCHASTHLQPSVVSDDPKYGNKQVISITPRLYDYILTNVQEPEILRQLREETASMRGSQMQVSPEQAQLLAMLVQILGAERCIEVGVYTGYSSLAIALVLPESGHLVACERDSKSLEVAIRYYRQAGVSHKVDVKHGLAADALKSLILNGESGRYVAVRTQPSDASSVGCIFIAKKKGQIDIEAFCLGNHMNGVKTTCYDFAFVDADKRMNQEYFELLLQLVRSGGVIVIDNVLWHGKVADPLVNDARTVSIRNFNKNIMEDERVSISMVPIGDGITICRKR